MSDDDDSLTAGAQEVESASAGARTRPASSFSVALARLVERGKERGLSSAPGFDRTLQPPQPVNPSAVLVDTVLLKVASRCSIDCSYCYVYHLG